MIKYASLFIAAFLISSCLGDNTNVLINPGFEDTNGWSARMCTFTYSSADKHSGSKSGLASSRTATYDGIMQTIIDEVVPGCTYTFSAYLKLANGSSDTVKITLRKNFINDSNTYTATLATGTATNSSWTYISGTYTVDANLTNLYFYFEGPAAGINFYVDDANVFGPSEIDSNAAANINTSTRYQKLEGFGAAVSWYDGTLVTLGTSNPNIYNVLFRDLGLDIYRMRNCYDESGGSSYIANAATITSHAATSLGHPIKTLLSSWSPPAYLKSNSNTAEGTLAKDFNDPNTGSSGYVYQRFAKWWYDSINSFSNSGVPITYASMQNEPDYTNPGWDTCQINPTESTSYAGYNYAFQAFASKIATLSNPPKLLAPETAGFVQLSSYLNNLFDMSPIYGYAHHYYNSYAGSTGANPDGLINDMCSVATYLSDKPLMMTEFSAGEVNYTDAMTLAKLMYNSLTVENVSSYYYWDLFWPSSGGLVSITTSSYTINPVYWAFKHYAYFTDPNWQRIDASANSSDLRISAYISPDNNQMSIVLLNTSTSTRFALDFNSFGYFQISDGNVWQTSSAQNCALVGEFNQASALSLPKNSITTVALTGKLLPSNCQDVNNFGYRLPGDLNGDCYVNSEDLKLMADNWLNSNCASSNNCSNADISQDGTVNFADFRSFAGQWMQCNNPPDANCASN